MSPAANVEKDESHMNIMSYLPFLWECSACLGALKLHQRLIVQQLNPA